MEVQGKIKLIRETATFGASGFRKREIVITTNEQYPQDLQLEFVQDKCDVLNGYEVGQDVVIGINLRGREWINPEGKAVYFNTIQGWNIKKLEVTDVPPISPITEPLNEPVDDGLPF